MSEYGVEFEDEENAEGELHRMDHLICTFQGNDKTIERVIELISKEFKLIKCHERKCQWMDKK